MKASRQRKCTRSQNRYAAHKEGRMPDRARRPSLRKPQSVVAEAAQIAEAAGWPLAARETVGKRTAAP